MPEEDSHIVLKSLFYDMLLDHISYEAPSTAPWPQDRKGCESPKPTREPSYITLIVNSPLKNVRIAPSFGHFNIG